MNYKFDDSRYKKKKKILRGCDFEFMNESQVINTIFYYRIRGGIERFEIVVQRDTYSSYFE